MKVVEGLEDESRAEVWLKAVKYLIEEADSREEYNLILHIPNPLNSHEKSEFIERKFDQMLNDASCQSLHTVAETIFPFSEYRMTGSDGVFNTYPDKVHKKIKKLPGNQRGTYAYRILRGKNWKGEECKPLENIIERLRKQLGNRGAIRMAYELPVSDVTNINISRHDTTLRGFPCMSHISFKLSSDKKSIHTTVIYRSHDYVQKVLGNLLGIARLQWFVAHELDLDVGELTCVSTFGALTAPTGLTVQKLSNLITEAENI